jgi:hypothetical protein
MLHCNMTTSTTLQLGLDDLLADLMHARRQGELGRLALLAYCEVRCWARQAGEVELAEHSTTIFTEHPHDSREDFLNQVDDLIAELMLVKRKFLESSTLPGLTLPHPPMSNAGHTQQYN